MYGSIYVPADNSDHSNASVDLAVALAEPGSRLVGSHVYAAKLHDVRFKQMEFTLPDEYKEEEELEKQRKIHDALIARGLHLISDSYLDQMETRCQEKGLAFERKHFDGKNFECLVEDVNASGYDLVVMGALGMGAVKDSQVGSVCERVLRRTQADTIVVRDLEAKDPSAPGPILVALDGSPQAQGALRTALALASRFGKALVLVAVVEDESERDLLAAHLESAHHLAASRGVTATTRLLTGRAKPELVAACAEAAPWLVACGRAGLDAADGAELGSCAEHLVRHGRHNVLLSARAWDVAAALASSDAA
jgi:nucleotide-binding universal stress UspA family protein